jgi:hypothetical protein
MPRRVPPGTPPANHPDGDTTFGTSGALPSASQSAIVSFPAQRCGTSRPPSTGEQTNDEARVRRPDEFGDGARARALTASSRRLGRDGWEPARVRWKRADLSELPGGGAAALRVRSCEVTSSTWATTYANLRRPSFDRVERKSFTSDACPAGPRAGAPADSKAGRDGPHASWATASNTAGRVAPIDQAEQLRPRAAPRAGLRAMAAARSIHPTSAPSIPDRTQAHPQGTVLEAAPKARLRRQPRGARAPSAPTMTEERYDDGRSHYCRPSRDARFPASCRVLRRWEL